MSTPGIPVDLSKRDNQSLQSQLDNDRAQRKTEAPLYPELLEEQARRQGKARAEGEAS